MQRNAIYTLPQLKKHQIKKRDPIGRGSFAIVYKGFFNQQVVAIKEAIPNKHKSIRSIKHEINMIEQLQPQSQKDKQSAAYILQYHGYFEKIKNRHPYKTKSIFIVMEYADSQNLSTWMSTTDASIISNASLQIATGLAQALSYIHNKDMIHCDLKADNILVFTNNHPHIHAKIGDFGLALFKNHTHDPRGTPLYFAPELLLGLSSNTTASDVYALALVFWELYAQELLENEYQNVDTQSELAEVIGVKQERPAIPAKCPKKMADLIKWCWHQTPADRPDAAQISDTLSEKPEKVTLS